MAPSIKRPDVVMLLLLLLRQPRWCLRCQLYLLFLIAPCAGCNPVLPCCPAAGWILRREGGCRHWPGAVVLVAAVSEGFGVPGTSYHTHCSGGGGAGRLGGGSSRGSVLVLVVGGLSGVCCCSRDGNPVCDTATVMHEGLDQWQMQFSSRHQGGESCRCRNRAAVSPKCQEQSSRCRTLFKLLRVTSSPQYCTQTAQSPPASISRSVGKGVIGQDPIGRLVPGLRVQGEDEGSPKKSVFCTFIFLLKQAPVLDRPLVRSRQLSNQMLTSW